MTDPSTIRAAVAEHGSQRAAARHLGIAESTLRGILRREPEEVVEAVPVRYAREKGSKRDQGVRTPKAPQNQPKAPAQPTEDELVRRDALRRRRSRRLRFAEFRRAFKGILPIASQRSVMLDPALARALGEMRREAGRFVRQEQAEAREAVTA